MTGGGAASASVGGVPNDRGGVVVVLGGCTDEMGVEPARPELGSGEGQRHIVVARGFAAPVPGGADLDPVRHYSVVGLAVVRLARVGHDLDVGADGEGLELALDRKSTRLNSSH